MRVLGFILLLSISYVSFSHGFNEEEKDHLTIAQFPDDVSIKRETKYFLYEINFGEGFNLRRDVYMRVAAVVKHLRDQGFNYILVLPPWGNLYHWRDRAVKIPWKKLFDVESLNHYVPVMEFEEYLSQNGEVIDGVVYLQRYKEGWRDDKWEERFDVRDCIDADRYYRKVENQWKGFFYTYEDVSAKNLTCLSLQGESKTFSKAIVDFFSNWNSIFVDRAETILHDGFGSKSYWEVRRSMRYSKNLRGIADDFIRKILNQEKVNVDIYYPKDWLEEKEGKRTSQGGDYISAHLRRQDFLQSHREHVPSIPGAAKELIRVAKQLSIKRVFLCTDGEREEVNQLSELLNKDGISLFRFTANDLSDVEISIVDQIIASKARYFIGTHSSTFSYRIREDREIMHFPIESTFNDFCKNITNCEQPAKWTITYQ